MNTTLTSFSDQPRLKLISRAIEPLSAIPLLSQSTNEIRGVNSSENSGFLRLSAQTPAKSCIDLTGDNTSSTNAIYSNSIRFNTGNNERMIINASGNVGIGTNTPGVRLDVVGGQGRVNSGATTNTALTTTGRVGVNNASPGVDLDITGAARVNSGATTNTALTTTGRVGINQSTPTVPLDVVGAARISGELDMNNSGKIVKLRNPEDAQDAATRFYVDSGVANATAVGNNAQSTANTAVANAATAQSTANTAQSTANTAVANMATSSSVSTAITNALGSSGTQENRPTVQRGDTTNDTFYLTYINTSDRPEPDGLSKRALLRCDNQLLYNSNNNTLYAGIFSGSITVIGGSGYFDGNVGIGTSSPSAPLHVFGSNSNTITGSGRYFDSMGNTGFWSPTIAISFITENSIWNKGTYIWITSDQRIKKNITSLKADKMMNIFRHIRPISFDFIDPIKNNNKKHFGFIAQEVNEILPEGITLNTDVIPNNMMKADIAKPSETDETPCFTLKPDDTDITLQYLLLTTDNPISFDISNSYSSTDTYKFKVYCGKEWVKEHDIYIRSEYNVTDDKYTYVIGMKKEAYDVALTEPTLFVYGQYVYDLHILEHDTIYTVATAALQEVDRQQQADKARIADLEATVAAQQSLINDILERLKSNGM